MNDSANTSELNAMLDHLDIEVPSLGKIRKRGGKLVRRRKMAAIAAFTALAAGSGAAIALLSNERVELRVATPEAEGVAVEGLTRIDAPTRPVDAFNAFLADRPGPVVDETGGGLRLLPPDSIFDYLPDGPMELSSSIVRGQIIAVEPGRSFRWTQEGDRDLRHAGRFGEDDSLVNSFHLRIEVSSFGPSGAEVGSEITVAMFSRPSAQLADIQREMMALQDVVLFLNDDLPILDYAPNLNGVSGEGDLWGIVTDDGSIEFPLADESLLPTVPIQPVDLGLA